ncbi:hypothetical protein HU200_051349 [Digitaria exilis]|uniref:Uncharacterized protein n=1 Tax=Digitaria exilis TaxID=1010633 RepID=A0A835AS01_9POAL|nr:hypothetical protein HU200_051349 [Digitaria exilis]
MAAMARNTVVLLVLVGIVVQLCSVVPPTAAAGRVLADQAKCPEGGAGGNFDNGINGGGEVKCDGKSLGKGAAWVGKDGKQHVTGEAAGVQLININT